MNRSPIITVMGHVDHGKTSLLDALRGTRVTDSESGGITQHTAASQIDYKGNKITFIDTPGHEAFSEMRARGGKIADIAILVVAANDGVMPQTKEAISHIKSVGIPMIVAINKIDLPDVSSEKVKKQLHGEGVMLEEYGGDVICVEVSATKGTNLDKLLESIVALWETIQPSIKYLDGLSGFVLESKHSNKKGYLVDVVLRSGVLNVSDTVVIGGRVVFKVRAITDGTGKNVKSISSGEPGQLLGLKESVDPGEKIELYNGQELTPEGTGEGEIENASGINIILRADTEGTLEAIASALSKISYEDKKINILLKGVGDVKESDILLASPSKAIVIAFKAKIPSNVKDRAEQQKVLTRQYSVIYELIQELEGALEGVYELEEEKVKGRAEILKVFPLPSGDVVAGCYVTHGRLKHNDGVKILEEDKELFRTKIKTLKKANNKVDLIGKDTECGVLLVSGSEKLKEGYTIEVL